MSFIKKYQILSFLFLFVLFQSLFCPSFAIETEKNDFLLVPESEEYEIDWTQRVKRISNSWGHVWDQYDKEAYDIWWPDKKNANSIWEQMATGILNWNSLIDYLVYALKILSELALLIWALMFIRNWYQYASSALTWEEPKKQKLHYAIWWILVVIFSYAIMRILVVMFIT